ncbi:hypothetical protein CYLTODRAFT_414545 [Cylindrobasidium torrendii FP15055 ss-10]|uniref:Uncharacterized protein n=1 Tax=Cylindrobasidium torrendii FP15055 ss-10 TaxID=1314674 RepID=A0A0D7AXL4_9AGAR|nr:hypothetical protein CYLTODRAFT_414545 [Cylindrobasidium torrendii FP15055 ss-10]
MSTVFGMSPNEYFIADLLSLYYEALSINNTQAALTSEDLFAAAVAARLVLDDACCSLEAEYKAFVDDTDVPGVSRRSGNHSYSPTLEWLQECALYEFSLRRLNLDEADFALGHIVYCHRVSRELGRVRYFSEAYPIIHSTTASTPQNEALDALHLQPNQSSSAMD